MKRLDRLALRAVAPAILAGILGCSGCGDCDDTPPPPPPLATLCGGDFGIGDIVEWAAAIDYPYDVDEFLVDPAEVPMELYVRVFGEAYGLDTVFEIIDPYGAVLDVVDDTIGRDPDGWYLLDVCGPWIVRVYAYDDATGPYDLVTEGY